MRCVATNAAGEKLALPAALDFTFRYGLGSPCDSFEVTCLWTPGGEEKLKDICRFRAEWDGETVFTGVVDEWRCVRDGSGSRLELAGRGMQALLLDNEALAAEYQLATGADILKNHVKPYGIEALEGWSLRPAAGFQAAAGSSQWSVVYDFARYYNGVTPRFDRLGRLALSPWGDEKTRLLGDRTPVRRLVCGEQRYGVLSSVLVRDKARGATVTAKNETFLAAGGSCRRVMNTAGRSTNAAMARAGQFQLDKSRLEYRQCRAEIPEAFFAWPGELLEVKRTGFGWNGVYRVLESETGIDGDGVYTGLVLGDADAVI